MRRIASLILSVFVVSCSSPPQKEELPVARAYDKYLYPSDLEGVVPEALHGPDSIQVVRSYIDNWIRKAVILKKAERNIEMHSNDFQEQINDYRNSLLIYYYEQALVAEQLDTVVNEQEMRSYYRENKDNFLLADDVYQVAYASVDANAPGITDIQGKMLDRSPEALEELTRYSLLHASSYSFNDTSWYSFRELSAFLPVDSIGEDGVEPGRVFEIKSKNTVFLIAFRERRQKNTVSPFGMERRNIRNILLNQRRLDLLAEMEKQVYDKALGNNDFEIYSR